MDIDEACNVTENLIFGGAKASKLRQESIELVSTIIGLLPADALLKNRRLEISHPDLDGHWVLQFLDKKAAIILYDKRLCTLFDSRNNSIKIENIRRVRESLHFLILGLKRHFPEISKWWKPLIDIADIY